MKTDAHYDVVVIGSGLGGLTAASLLTKVGEKVIVFEQHHKPGGYCTTLHRKGFEFDAAIHYIGYGGEGQFFDRFFSYLGLKNEIGRVPLNRDCVDKFIFPDFEFYCPADILQLHQNLAQAFPHYHQSIKSHARALLSIDRMSNSFFRGMNLWDYFSIPLSLLPTTRWVRASYQSYLDRKFPDPKLQAVLSGQWPNIGEPPSNISYPFYMDIVTFFLSNPWYPRGGSQRMPDALVKKIQEGGGEIRLKTPVKKILTDGKAVKGVLLQNGCFSAKGTCSGSLSCRFQLWRTWDDGVDHVRH